MAELVLNHVYKDYNTIPRCIYKFFEKYGTLFRKACRGTTYNGLFPVCVVWPLSLQRVVQKRLSVSF